MNTLLLALSLGTFAVSTSSSPVPYDTATFAGGRFWVLERLFEELDGVVEVTAGYTGGTARDPSYREVSTGRSGHFEAVRVVYDPARITYHQLVVFFWHNVDPLTPNAQFCDNGTQYGTAIFYRNAAQQAVAENTKQYVLRWFRVRSIPTRVAPAGRFYPAEEQHQDYASKDSSAFEFYRMGCNRETRLAELWGRKAGTYVRGWDPLRFEKPSDEQLRASLTPLQYQVTQEGATEPANDNEFWDHKLPGIYVDVVSGEPLFGSPDKFDAGAGWPSFSGPLDPTVVIEYPDSSGETVRTGVRSTFAGSRLGHVIDDPRSPTGKRYSINSAALRFIHADRLVAEGYRDLAVLFSPEARYRQARD